MEKIFEKIKQTRDIELPFNISKKVMKKIVFYRLRFPSIFVGLFFVNLVFLCYRIYEYLTINGAMFIIKAITSNFEISWDYIGESWQGLIETMPMRKISLLVINVVVICFLTVYIYKSYKSQIKKLSVNF